VADRTVNININYKVNTADIQRAQAASNAAQKATENLRKATQDYGKAGQQAGKAASDGLKQVTDSAKGASTETQGLAQSLSGLYGAVKSVVTAGIVRELLDMSLNMARLSGNVQGVERAFRRAFPEATLILQELRDATRGTVTDFELMQRTLQATNLGVSVEHLGVLFQFAAARAQQTGESVDYLVDSIVRGIGRKSILILDNLGLSATRLKEQFDGAAIASKSVGEVTEGVAEIARVELQKMGGYIDTAATSADQLTAAFKEFQTEAAKASEPINRGITQILTEAANGARALFKIIQEARNSQPTNEDDTFIGFLKRLMSEESAATKVVKDEEAKRQAIREANFFKEVSLTEDIRKNREEALGVIQREVDAQAQKVIANNSEIQQLKARRDLINQAFDVRASEEEREKSIAFQNQEIDRIIKTQNVSRREAKKLLFEQNDESAKAIEFYEFQNLKVSEYITLLQSAAQEFQKISEPPPQSGIIERKKEEIKLLEEQIEKTNNLSDLQTKIEGTGVTVAGPLIQALEIAKSELEALEKSFNNFDIKPFKIEPVKNATKEFTNIEEVTKRVEENIRLISEGLITLGQTRPGIVDLRTELEKAFAAQKDLLVTSGIDIVAGQLNSIAQMEADSYNLRISQLQAFYDNQLELAGDNENAKDQIRKKEQREIDALRREQFKKEKEAQRLQVIINTAASIAKTAAMLGYPAAIPFIILAAAEGAAQLAIINRQTPRFAKGVLNLKGPGTETSDSIPAMLSKGESVMTSDETRRAFGVLKAVKDNRLDDRMLKRLQLTHEGVKVVPWDNRPVVDAIKGNRPPNLVREGRQIYEVYEDKKRHKKFVRSKSM
jgi:hypothetical protein